MCTGPKLLAVKTLEKILVFYYLYNEKTIDILEL